MSSQVIIPEIVPSLPPSVILPEELNNRQKLFVIYYLETRNGTRSAKLAGYEGSDDVLAVTASRLLNHDKVRFALESYFQARILSANGVLSELSDIAFAPLSDMEAKEGENGLIPPVLKPSDKIKSLELLGKFHRLFADKVETEVSLSDQDVDRLTESFIQACLNKRNEIRQLQGNEDKPSITEP